MSLQVAKIVVSNAPVPKLQAGIIYSADHGELICLHCAGLSAKFTGRDRSGQRVKAMGPVDAKAWLAWTGKPLTCEAGCTKYLGEEQL